MGAWSHSKVTETWCIEYDYFLVYMMDKDAYIRL